MVILALLAVIGGPIIINECYKGDSGYIAIWSAADTLSYYGTVLGALVAAATIAVTIIFTRKQLQRESFSQKRNRKVVKYRKNNCSNTGCDQSHSPFT